MKTSSHGNAFLVTGLLWGQSAGHRWIHKSQQCWASMFTLNQSRCHYLSRCIIFCPGRQLMVFYSISHCLLIVEAKQTELNIYIYIYMCVWGGGGGGDKHICFRVIVHFREKARIFTLTILGKSELFYLYMHYQAGNLWIVETWFGIWSLSTALKTISIHCFPFAFNLYVRK